MAGQLPPRLRLKLWLRRLKLKLFPPPFVRSPDDTDGYPRNDAIILKAILARWSDELAALRRLGIPVPREVTPLTVTPELSTVYSLRISYPVYDLPPHFLFQARLPHAPGTPPYTAPKPATYFFAADQSAVAAAGAMLAEKGLLEVARRFPGRWYSRDPYALLKPYGAQGIGLTPPTNDISVPAMLRAVEGLMPPLEALYGYPLQEMERMQRRLDFYGAFAPSPRIPSLAQMLRYNEKDWHPPQIPDAVLFGLPLPMPSFSTAPLSLKILPAGDAPPAMMQSFLAALRAVQRPVAFELIDDGSTAYLQLCCAPDDADLVARQIRLHFPDFGAEEHGGAPAFPLHSVGVRPAALCQSTRALSDFTLEPFGQLFAVLEDAPADAVTAFQVLFFPLPDAALATVLEHLQGEAKSRPDAELAERVRQAAHKLPAWQAAVRLFCSHPDTLLKLKTSFLGQYGQPGQPLLFTEQQAAVTERDMGDWMMLSTQELAALAHFPTSEAVI